MLLIGFYGKFRKSIFGSPFSEVHFRKSNFSEVQFFGSPFSEVNFRKSIFGSPFSEVQFFGSPFSEVNFRKSNFRKSNFRKHIFRKYIFGSTFRKYIFRSTLFSEIHFGENCPHLRELDLRIGELRTVRNYSDLSAEWCTSHFRQQGRVKNNNLRRPERSLSRTSRRIICGGRSVVSLRHHECALLLQLQLKPQAPARKVTNAHQRLRLLRRQPTHQSTDS